MQKIRFYFEVEGSWPTNPFHPALLICILKLVRHNTAPTTNWIKNILLFSSVPTKTWNTNVEISHQMLKRLAILQINYQI